MALKWKRRDAHREKLIQYLGNPENEWLSKEDLSVKILKMKCKNFISKAWSPEEFDREVAVPALTLRRGRYARDLAEVDRALLRKAKNGDVRAAKLVYQRFENWKESNRTEFEANHKAEVRHSEIDDFFVQRIQEDPVAARLATELLGQITCGPDGEPATAQEG